MPCPEPLHFYHVAGYVNDNQCCPLPDILFRVCVCVCACVRACVRARGRACVRASERACGRVFVSLCLLRPDTLHTLILHST